MEYRIDHSIKYVSFYITNLTIDTDISTEPESSRTESNGIC